MYYAITYTTRYLSFILFFQSEALSSATSRSGVVISSVWLKASELLFIQQTFSLRSFFKSLVMYFFISPAVSRISQQRQHHYQSKMCSFILLLCSDKGTARRVTQVHLVALQKTTFLSLKHTLACQLLPLSNGRISLVVHVTTCATWHTWTLSTLCLNLPKEQVTSFSQSHTSICHLLAPL